LNITWIEELLGEKPLSIESLSGGDIAHAQKVTTRNNSYFMKSASFKNAEQLFKKEAMGLQEMAKTKTIGIPEIMGTFSREQTACLILEYIASKSPSPSDYECFGRHLAQLHGTRTKTSFGFKTDNFIGKLPQTNTESNNWVNFYVGQRLLPQLKMAFDSGQLSKEQLPSTDRMTTVCEAMIGKVAPSLLHGDLWSGNYLISTKGEPYLIDPAVYYGHNEVDLAMTRLFGGFSNAFYEAYHEIIPPHPNQAALVDIYQLYYVLVQLNLFGSSYRASVNQLLKKYFA
jgi:fructosamine-3-kinase